MYIKAIRFLFLYMHVEKIIKINMPWCKYSYLLKKFSFLSFFSGIVIYEHNIST